MNGLSITRIEWKVWKKKKATWGLWRQLGKRSGSMLFGEKTMCAKKKVTHGKTTFWKWPGGIKPLTEAVQPIWNQSTCPFLRWCWAWRAFAANLAETWKIYRELCARQSKTTQESGRLLKDREKPQRGRFQKWQIQSIKKIRRILVSTKVSTMAPSCSLTWRSQVHLKDFSKQSDHTLVISHSSDFYAVPSSYVSQLWSPSISQETSSPTVAFKGGSTFKEKERQVRREEMAHNYGPRKMEPGAVSTA